MISNMSNKNFESNTAHGHDTFLSEMKMRTHADEETIPSQKEIDECNEQVELQNEKEEFRDCLLKQMNDDKVRKNSDEKERMRSNVGKILPMTEFDISRFSNMPNHNFNHMNFESDTIHGHDTFVDEEKMHFHDDGDNPQNQNEMDDYNKKQNVRTEKEEYRDCLLKQMKGDKERKIKEKKERMRGNSGDISSRAQFSEEALDALGFSHKPNHDYSHANFESDTVHGHDTFMDERKMHFHSDEVHPQNQKEMDDYNKKKDLRTEKEEYRDCLLKQMKGDKERKNKDDKKRKNYDSGNSCVTRAEEAALHTSKEHDLKLQKQKEVRQDLDDCIKMKQELRMKTHRVEVAEEQERTEFCLKRDDDNIHALEKSKLLSERNEHTMNDVALPRMADERDDIKNGKFIDALNEKEDVSDLNEHRRELVDMQESIRLKKELFEENEEKINEWLENLKILKMEQEKLTENIEREEALEQKLQYKYNDIPISLT